MHIAFAIGMYPIFRPGRPAKTRIFVLRRSEPIAVPGEEKAACDHGDDDAGYDGGYLGLGEVAWDFGEGG